jgi:hypothetical protein
MNAGKWGLALCTALSLCAGCAPRPTENIPILSGDVRVTARLVEDLQVVYGFDIAAEHAGDRYTWSTVVRAKCAADAISELRKQTGWKLGYLFVPESTGGGTAWRVSREHVFALRAERLAHVGEVLAGGDAPGSGYEDGCFADIYDKFEMNDLTDHASAPGVLMYSRDKDGSLVVDMDYTWEQNCERFAESMAQIARATRASSKPEEGWHMVADILSNAVTAKYCRRAAELKQMMRIAEARLDPKHLRILKDIVADVSPGELPKWVGTDFRFCGQAQAK